MRRTIATAVVGVLAVGLGACALTLPIRCPEAPPAPQPQLSCEAAGAAARPQLESVVDVTAMRFEYQLCGDNQRCAVPDAAAGNVIATLSDGREVAVFVSIGQDGIVRAEPPRELTPEPQPVAPGG